MKFDQKNGKKTNLGKDELVAQQVTQLSPNFKELQKHKQGHQSYKKIIQNKTTQTNYSQARIIPNKTTQTNYSQASNVKANIPKILNS